MLTTLVKPQKEDAQHDWIELLCLIEVTWQAHYELGLRILKVVIFSTYKCNQFKKVKISIVPKGIFSSKYRLKAMELTIELY